MGERGKLKLPRHLAPIPNNGEPTLADQVQPGIPVTPAGFPNDKMMTELWVELVPKLDAAGLIASTDGMAVEMAIRHFLAAREASDELMADGAVVNDTAHGRDNGGVKKNPADQVFRSQSQMFLEYVKQLGMAYAARARIPGRLEDGGDDFFTASGG